MEEQEQFRSLTEHKSVLGIVTEFNNKQIDLTAKYQRDIVWKEEQKIAFINSVYKGIVPNNLILCKDDDNGKLICIDGKQRISSLIEFCKNKIPLILESNEKELIYYTKLPENQDNTKTYRSFTPKEKINFDNRSIPVVKYDNLEYKDQVDIFYRIQKGAKLTQGELMLSIFQSDKACEIYNDFCESKKNLVSKYVKNGKDRKGHVILISNILYLIESENDDLPNKKNLSVFFRKYDKMNDMRKLVKNVGDKINIYFSDNLFGNSIFTKKFIEEINNGLFQSLFLCCKEQNYDLIKMNNKQLNILRKVIVSTIKVYNNTCKKLLGNKKNITKNVLDIFKNQEEKIVESSESSESDNESENNKAVNDDNTDKKEESISEEDYVIHEVKKKRNNKYTKNV